MSKPVIEIKKLSKAYMIGHEREAMADWLIETLGAWEKRWLQLRIVPLWKLLADHAELLESKANWIPLKILHPGKTAIYFSSNAESFLGEVLGFVGELHPFHKNQILNVATGQNLDVSLGEFRIIEDMWEEAYKASKRFLSGVLPAGKIEQSSKFPMVERDLAFVFDSEIVVNDVLKTIEKEASTLLKKLDCLDRFVLEDKKVSLAFRLSLQNSEKTLEDAEIQELIKRCVDKVEKRFSASLRA
jgi:phenylalanyl-tRNA synthetase beta chain